MGAKPIDRLESQIEALTEGLFTRLFQRAIHVRDIAILLLRAMDDQAVIAAENEQSPIAPDTYTIFVRPESFDQLRVQMPDYLQRFNELLIELAREAGYSYLCPPSVMIVPSEDKLDQAAHVYAEHSMFALGETKAAPAVDSGAATLEHQAPLIVLGNGRAIELDKVLVTIGREDDNDIVVDDAYVSRYHLRLRKRSGRFTLFDVASRGGTRVNNTTTNEHILQSGDRIQFGRTCLTYIDRSAQKPGDGTTQILVPD